MAYLEQHRFVHRDPGRPQLALVSDGSVVKVADFGLTRCLEVLSAREATRMDKPPPADLCLFYQLMRLCWLWEPEAAAGFRAAARRTDAASATRAACRAAAAERGRGASRAPTAIRQTMSPATTAAPPAAPIGVEDLICKQQQQQHRELPRLMRNWTIQVCTTELVVLRRTPQAAVAVGSPELGANVRRSVAAVEDQRFSRLRFVTCPAWQRAASAAAHDNSASSTAAVAHMRSNVSTPVDAPSSSRRALPWTLTIIITIATIATRHRRLRGFSNTSDCRSNEQARRHRTSSSPARSAGRRRQRRRNGDSQRHRRQLRVQHVV
uniref:Pkinase_Tyr domain-containing protein n=1 Tax=Macrostomum lignano TaxID=282301 RepID=A0A1I8FLY0_9PLAT